MAWSLRKPIQDSGWTISTVLEYVNARISDMELRNQQRFEAQINATAQRNQDMELRQQQRFEAQTKAIEAALIAQRAAIDAALVATDRATSKAETATELRFQSVNEFRQTLSDQASAFITRKEVESAIGRNTERIGDITTRLQDIATKAEVINAFEGLDLRLRRAEESNTRKEGKGSGLTAGWGYLVAIVGLVATVVAIYIAIHGGK